MLPTLLTHLDKNKQKKQKQTTQQRHQVTSTTSHWCCTFPLVLLLLGFTLVLHSDSSNAEKDFNFNDSQVPVLEPKDEPILIDHHHISSSSSGSRSSISSISSGGDSSSHQYHHNHHQHHRIENPYAVELSQCLYNDDEILLSLVLKNHNWHDFNQTRKDQILEKLSQFFAIPKKFITTESVTKHELLEMQKVFLKKGNNKCHNTNRKLGRVNFIVGCGSKYFTVTQPIAKQIGQQIKDGALDNITGEKFGWWVIWRKEYKTRSVRNRRQVEGSGDDEDDDDYYDYDDDTEDIDTTTTSTTHVHRYHHGEDTSEITSNMLEVTNVKNNNNINNNDIQSIASNKINDDITALKQTDPNTNEAAEEQVEKTDDSNLLLLNKKDNIDEEIVESVSQLESVITKTIENTKNLEEVPDIVVDQPEDDMLSEVLQPLNTIEGMESVPKATDNLNMNAIYESPSEGESDDDNKDFNVAEVVDSLTPSTTVASTYSSTATKFSNNSPATITLAGVNAQENIESFSDSTTPFSLTNNSNKNNHLDLSPTASPSSKTHDHSHYASQNLEPLHAITETTTSISTSSHLTPAILIDPTATTRTTTTTAATNALLDSSSTVSPLSSSSSSSSFLPSSPSSSSVSSSTMSSTVLQKNELPSNSVSIENGYNSEKYNNNNNNNNDDDDNDDDNNEVDKAGLDEQQKREFKKGHNINEESWNILTTIMAIPAAATTAKSQQMMAITTEQQEQQQHQQKHKNQHQHLHQHQHHHQRQQHEYYPVHNDNSREILEIKPTPAPAINFAPSLATSLMIDKLAIATTTPLTSSSSSSLSSSSAITTATTATTTRKPSSLLTKPSLETPTPSSSSSSPDLLIDNVFPIHTSIYGKKDDTTVEPKDIQDLNKMSTSTFQSTGDNSGSISTQSSTTAITSQATTVASPTSPEFISSSTGLPDYVEPKMENTPPIIKSRLQKLAVTSGKSFKLPVPEDTFYDNEDLTNLRLELTDKEGRELKTNSWLQFNAETKEIYGLPLDDAVSKWQYRLTATDSGNESVTETLEISVQQHRGVRTVNHEINVSVKVNEKNMHYIDWQLNLINAIAATLGDSNSNSIVVREIRANPQDPNTATLVYFNETLPTSECPERELNNLVKRLDVSRLSDLVQPILGIKSLTGQLIGPCQKPASTRPKTPTLNIKNAPPVPRNQVDRVVATVGHLLVYKVPSDTFFDPNDNVLKLSLKTKDHLELNPRHWLQFDSKNEEFYGIPKSGDIGSEEYMLVAEDSGGLTATDALVVQVNHAPKRDFSAYTKVYLAIRHEQFNADLQRKFVERIANLFGDASTQNIQVRSVTTHHDSDGTIVNFYNTTLFKSHNRCPEEEMEAMRNAYLHDYTVRERVKKALGPELNVTDVQVIRLGTCNAPTDVTHREFVPNKTEEPLLKSTFSEDNLYTIILPAIIIISMILIASIIAYCLHRRRRKSGKMELGDEEERKSFRTKGIPVIFQDELDEKPEIGNKSPIILKDEKPPLLPPSYNTSNMNGDNDVDEYVPPPAVVVGGREARGKSPATPSYRKPPPYVSP